MGNPIIYKGNVLTWTRGRLLNSYGATKYYYDVDGIRQEKIVNGVKHSYYTEGDKIHREVIGNDTLWCYYDQSGITGLEYNGTSYYLQKNLQGDIVRIFNNSGAVVASYAYDAWGNHKVYDASGVENTEATFIGNINPFRYRGYYYDTDTKYYHLDNRLYDSEIRRFINADDVLNSNYTSIYDANLYYYKINSSVNNKAVEQEGQSQTKNYSPINNNIFSAVNKKSSTKIYWDSQFFNTGLPSVLVFSNREATLLSWGISIYKFSLYFNENKAQSLYLSLGNFSAYAGWNVEQNKYGFMLGGSLASAGFDGKFIDASIDFIGAGFFLVYEKGRFTVKIDTFLLPGITISIDFGAILKSLWDLIFGG